MPSFGSNLMDKREKFGLSEYKNKTSLYSNADKLKRKGTHMGDESTVSMKFEGLDI